MFRLLLKIFICCFLFVFAVNAQTARVFDLGIQVNTGTFPDAINNNGQVLVHRAPQHYFIVGKFETIDIPLIPGNPMGFSDLNDLGQAAGYIELPCTDPNNYFIRTTAHITLFSTITRTLTDLGSLATPSVPCASAYGEKINNNGLIVGIVAGPNVTPYYNHVGIYANGQLLDLGMPFGSVFVSNNSLNDNGQIVGTVYYADSGSPSGFLAHAVIYEDGVWTDLGVQPGFFGSAPSGINNAGDIIGSSETINPQTSSSFLLRNGIWSSLGVMPGADNCYASKINNAGLIAGNCITNNNTVSIAVIYENANWTSVNSLIPSGSGWQIWNVRDLNDQGVMLCDAKLNGVFHTVLVDPNPDTTPPQLRSIPGSFTVAAESASGANVGFYTSAVDEYSTPAEVSCNHSSGSLFPIGSTLVTCQAIDAAGNTSPPQSFTIEVLDTAPNLSLPPYISTNATSASGAIVTYFASADDAVSGQLPATCSPASGSTFAVGQTTVSCSATDAAGNTSTGSFEVYVLTSDQIFTPPDWYVTLQPNNGPTINMYVESPGVTTVQPIDAATVGTTPAGFALSNGIAYQISTTAGVYFDYGVELIFAVPGPITEADFNNLRILHNNNGTLEDVTYYGEYNAETQSGNIHAYTYSFSPFYLAKRVNLKVAPLFDQTRAFKAGSTVPVKIRMLNENGNNVSAGTLPLKARNLVRLGSNSSSVVIDAGNANPDLNFRYDSGLQGYIFNLKTTGLTAGKYALSFYAGSDQSFFYTVQFEVK